jgi:hypothetical protein
LFVARGCCAPEVIEKGKTILEEIVKMLFAMLDQLGCRIAEDAPSFEERAEEEVAEDYSGDPGYGRSAGPT